MSKFPGITKSTNKIDYYKQSIETINSIKNNIKKPTLLIHACCAPCACFPLQFLNEVFDITIYYNNSNIYPQEEYEKRLNELKKYVETFHHEVKLIVPPYDYTNYIKYLEPLKDEPEGKGRCFLCYKLRIEQAYQYASIHHFDYVCSVMTISRQKDSQIINSIAKSLQPNYPSVKYFYSDFKKKQGIDIAVSLQKKHNMYKQQYCGCEYSMKKNKE